MAGETGGPEDRYLMFKAVERELKEMKNSIKVQRAMHDMTQQELADRRRKDDSSVYLGAHLDLRMPNSFQQKENGSGFRRSCSRHSAPQLALPRPICR